MQGWQDAKILHSRFSTICKTANKTQLGVSSKQHVTQETVDWISGPPLNPWALEREREREVTARGRLKDNKQRVAAGRSSSWRLFKGEAPSSEMTCSFSLINNFTKDGLEAALIDSVSLKVPALASQAHTDAPTTVCSSKLGGLLWVLIQSGYSLLRVRVHTVNRWAGHMPGSTTLTQTGRVAFLHKRMAKKIVQIKIELLAFLRTSLLKFLLFFRHVFLLLA